MSYQKITGIALILLVILVVGIWTILFLIGNPVYATWQDTVNHMLAPENGMRTTFYASVLSVVVSSISAVTYFSALSKSKKVLLSLLAISLLQAIPAVWFLDWDFKIIYSLPVIFGYLAYKYPNNRSKHRAQVG